MLQNVSFKEKARILFNFFPISFILRVNVYASQNVRRHLVQGTSMYLSFIELQMDFKHRKDFHLKINK